ncbi:hypothetical protein [Zoogloea sp.]|uniref:hypothetical protein n=1 Tax=Zoogloea sp. TaxID=49181 RepID=UPI0025D70009|nr:hypothetical protein [Zoogloea sp.]MCK6396056.1 hypothetical protein [Zoogloea sp.]
MGPLKLSGALPVALGIALVVGIAIGAGAAVVVKNGQIALIERNHARQAARDQAAQLAQLRAAQALGDGLTNDLLAARAEADQLQEQLHAALSRVTTGRPCLGGGALRLLDRAARTDLPQAAGRADAADAASTATDTQVAQWAGSAIHQYAECARRLDALIQFNEAPQ